MADTETLRPNAAGDEENIKTAVGDGAGTHYSCVDEETPDEATSYVEDEQSSTTYYRDLYNVADHSVGSGTINHITVYARCVGESVPSQASLKIATKSGTGTGAPDTVDESSEITVTSSWANYSNQWSTNPATGSAWTWDEIDKLQIGIAMRRGTGGGPPRWTRCTQVYVEVDYTSGATEKTSSDSGSGADAKASGNPIATLVKSETGSGSDVLSQAQAILDGAETGSGVDTVDSLETPEAKSSSDAGSGVEGTPVQSAFLAGSETGAGIEALITRLLAAFDAGYGVEASSIEVEGLLKNLFATELGEGSDALTTKIEMPTKGGGMRLWT